MPVILCHQANSKLRFFLVIYIIIEKGAEFQLFLKSAGSYENANQDERDILVCDEKGYAKSKKLPYGTY
ncbi:MAG: hypothetical protein ACI4I4_07430 [Acutalibacteraceae bacterium]